VLVNGAPFEPSSIEATITIAASDYAQSSILLPLMDVLRKEAPNVRVAWRAIDLSRLSTQLERGEVDVALVAPESAPDMLRMRTLYHESYVAIARLDHPSIQGSIDLDTFCELDHIVVSPMGGGFFGPTDRQLESIGRRRRVSLSTQGFLVVPEIVERSNMIAVMPHRIVRDRSNRLQVLNPPIAIPGFDIAMVWHDRTTTHPIYQWLRHRMTFVADDAFVSDAAHAR